MRAPAILIEELRGRDLIELAERCAKVGHVSVVEMLSDRRHLYSAARHAFWFALHEDQRFSVSSIGSIMGCNHTSIRAGLAAHLRRVQRSEDIGSYAHERAVGLEARVDDLERLSVRLERELERAHTRIETLEADLALRLNALETRRAS